MIGEEPTIIASSGTGDMEGVVIMAPFVQTIPEPVPDTKCPICHGRGYLEEGIGLVVRGCRACKETGVLTPIEVTDGNQGEIQDALNILPDPDIPVISSKTRKRKKAKKA